MMIKILDPEVRILRDLSQFIYESNGKEKNEIEYRMNHSVNVGQYAIEINKRLGSPASQRKLSYIAYAHDLLKECALNQSSPDLTWRDHPIPQNLNRYVRTHLDVLEKFEMDDYFNSEAGLHALAAAIFVCSEMGVSDPEIIYPIMFHSCPIIQVYEKLSKKVKTMVDIIVLSDKLASNISKINRLGKKAPCDLDLLVFGEKGKEFNYSMGLYVAMLLKAGGSGGPQSTKMIEEYYKRAKASNPFISDIKKGDNVEWPKRKSQVLKTPY